MTFYLKKNLFKQKISISHGVCNFHSCHFQLEAIVKMIYGRNETNVDWRRLLMCVAQPWAIPAAQQLVNAWTALTSGEQEIMGVVMISKEKFMSTEIWFEHPFEDSVEETDPQLKTDHGSNQDSNTFNRILALKEVSNYISITYLQVK